MRALRIPPMSQHRESKDHHRIIAVFENRPQFRVKCNLDGVFLVNGREQSARIVNVGLGGLRVDLPMELSVGQLLDVRIPLPEVSGDMEENQVLDLACQVIWTLFDQTDPPYPTGLKFRDVDPRKRRTLIRFLAGISRDD